MKTTKMKTTEENNKLIAEFMGWDVKSPTTIPPILHLSNLELDNEDVLVFKFHNSWDWLMPVVGKVRSVPSYDRDKFMTKVIISANETTIKSGSYGDMPHSRMFFNKTIRGEYNDINHTYKAVVEFIKWYNENK